MATQHARSPYKGDKPALVIAIDVGTTYSGASYSVLTPNQVPKIVDVSGFKGQEDQASSTKVPSILFYDSAGELLACGAQANESAITEEDYIKVEWFKLLMRPLSLGITLENAPDARLPPGKGVVDVFGDFLKYMVNCVRDYLIETQVDGPALWASMSKDAHYVLTHPNGWEGYQQSQMRDAAIIAGLIPKDPTAFKRIEFVTEGEASFHWCIDVGLADAALKVNSHVIVADAGGGTIDVSSFRVASLRPLRLEETAEAECRVSGSVFVTQAFRQKVEDKLSSSPYGTEEYIDRAVEEFDKKTKCLFRDKAQPSLIRLGARKDKDEKNGIKLGQLSLAGEFIAATFEQSCAGTTEAIQLQLINKRELSTKATVFLVGGFAASPWLYSELQRRLKNDSVDIKRADSHTSKAVAHGAVAYYLDHFVASRIAKYTYGTVLQYNYDPASPIHRKRLYRAFKCPVTGDLSLDGGFMSLVKKGETIKADAVYRSSLIIPTKLVESMDFSTSIWRYTGAMKNIEFLDMDHPSFFTQLCVFTAKVPPEALRFRYGDNGAYWIAEFDVVINLGTSELKCYVEWEEKNQKKQSPAASVWEDI